jgi:hypothetical protein
MYIYAAVLRKKSNEKQKPRRFSLICLPFAHQENRSLLFVSLLTKKQTEVIVHDGARFKNKLMGVMVYFQPAEK